MVPDEQIKADIRAVPLQPNAFMQQWISNYIEAHKAAIDSICQESVAEWIRIMKRLLDEDRQLFVFGNGGSACNASHFATDLGKGASDTLGRRFRVLTLNDNISWMTALGNDYCYEDIFVRQLMNYAKPGDAAMTLSVSGNSPNVVKAMQWAKDNEVTTLGLVGGKKGKVAEISDHTIVVDDPHYGRAEDGEMLVCHMLCYAFMENPEWGKADA